MSRVVMDAFPDVPLGIHTHNDCELGVANAIASVKAGATQVQGTINGLAAQGDGQVLFLANDVGNDAAGLQVRITGGEVGSRGDASFIEGVSERAVDAITNILGAEGALSSRTAALNRDLEGIQDDRFKLDLRIESYQARLVAQFSAADSLISQLNNTRDYVTQQLEALAPQNFNQ